MTDWKPTCELRGVTFHEGGWTIEQCWKDDEGNEKWVPMPVIHRKKTDAEQMIEIAVVNQYRRT